jgi:integrase
MQQHVISKNIRVRAPLIYGHLRSVGYKHEFSIRVSNLAKRLLGFYDNGTMSTYEEFAFYLIDKMKGHSEREARYYRLIARLIKDFVEHGRYLSFYDSGFMSRRTEFKLNSSYKSIVEIVKKKTLGKSESYKKNCACLISNFLYFLQTQGATDLSMVTENMVLDFFHDGKRAKYSSDCYYQGVKSCLGYCKGEFKDVEQIIGYLPKLRKHRKNIDFLKDEEIGTLKRFVEQGPPIISLRDKAIMTIGMYTGMRGCDVANLKIGDIDWANERIRIIQSKTAKELLLPLRPVVGNAIFDYITKERPQNCDAHIFLTEKIPRPMSNKNIGNITRRVMQKAGIRVNGGRAGFHLLRHSVATLLLKNNISTAIIASALGHASIESTNRYLSSDMDQLKEFALTIEQFPMGKEVFNL